ncbi:MAG: hypothetical protein AAGA46_11205 [Cyanobacteria bacterium P01_F01_bin.13]
MDNSLWDMAGVDGLAVAKYLFGEEVGYLAPFQSLETVLQGKDCSVLRLCDRNFRISYPGSLHALIEPLQANIWLKKFDWLTSMVLPDHLFSTIISHSTVRPPHRLKNIPNHQAVPAQLRGIPILLWRHPHQRKSSLELHIAQKDLKILEKFIATDITEAVQ